jgi:hypothetical protein
MAKFWILTRKKKRGGRSKLNARAHGAGIG